MPSQVSVSVDIRPCGFSYVPTATQEEPDEHETALSQLEVAPVGTGGSAVRRHALPNQLSANAWRWPAWLS
jgi:hypothetical protein